MKKSLLLTVATCALLIQLPSIQAASESKEQHKAKIAEMCQDKEMRVMMLMELTSSRERKMEVTRMLKEDSEFREMFGNLTTGGG